MNILLTRTGFYFSPNHVNRQDSTGKKGKTLTKTNDAQTAPSGLVKAKTSCAAFRGSCGAQKSTAWAPSSFQLRIPVNSFAFLLSCGISSAFPPPTALPSNKGAAFPCDSPSTPLRQHFSNNWF